MRLVAGAALLIRGAMGLFANAPATSTIVEVVEIAAGVMLMAGLWTPVAASVVGIIALRNAFLHMGDEWACIFLTTMGAALALLGPGGWSVDARLFGWRRIDVRDRRR